jgi:hypothetical protein
LVNDCFGVKPVIAYPDVLIPTMTCPESGPAGAQCQNRLAWLAMLTVRSVVGPSHAWL